MKYNKLINDVANINECSDNEAYQLVSDKFTKAWFERGDEKEVSDESATKFLEWIKENKKGYEENTFIDQIPYVEQEINYDYNIDRFEKEI